MDIREFEKLKVDLSNTEKEMSRNEGALASLMEQLESKFQVKTLREATALLAILEADGEKYTKEINELFTKIEEIVRETK